MSGCGSKFRTIEPARMIKLVAHRSDWASDFSVEARRILESFGASALRIDHVGSTAVPGLLAKPGFVRHELALIAAHSDDARVM